MGFSEITQLLFVLLSFQLSLDQCLCHGFRTRQRRAVVPLIRRIVITRIQTVEFSLIADGSLCPSLQLKALTHQTPQD